MNLTPRPGGSGRFLFRAGDEVTLIEIDLDGEALRAALDQTRSGDAET